MGLNPTWMLSLCGVISSFLFGYLGYRRGKTADWGARGETKGTILSDIGYIKAGVDDLKREQKDTLARLSQLAERLSRCEESCKQAHKRIGELKNEGLPHHGGM